MKAQLTTKILSNKKNRIDLNNAIPLSTPLGIELGLSGICNLKCKFCFQSNPLISEKYQKLGLMDEELFKKIIKDIKEFPDKVKNLKIIGIAEELVNPKAADYITFACQQDVANLVELTTNGVLLNKNLSDRLIASGLGRINISIEALSDSGYYDICGKNVDFTKLVSEIEYLYNEKERLGKNLIVYVKIADIVLKDNEDEGRFFSLFGDICDEIYIEHIIPAWQAKDNVSSDWIKSKNDSVELDIGEFKQVAQYKKTCPFPFTKLYIAPNGLVLYCVPFAAIDNPLGDVHTDSLKDIWNGQKLFDFHVAQLQGNRETYSSCVDCQLNKFIAIDNIDHSASSILKRVIERGKQNGLVIAKK